MTRFDIKIRHQQFGKGRIQQHKDYHSLLERYRKRRKRRGRNMMLLAMIVVLVISVLIMILK